jgi:hypothetical protein
MNGSTWVIDTTRRGPELALTVSVICADDDKNVVSPL